MKKCCCCIPVAVGSAILGVIGLLVSVPEFILLFAYLVNFESFNPIGKNLNDVYYIVEKTLIDQNGMDPDEVSDLIDVARSFTFAVFLAEAVMTALYALTCLLLLIGVGTSKRAFVIPYLVYNLIFTVATVAIMSVLTVVTFFVDATHGSITLGIALCVSGVLIHFWVVVLRCYQNMSERDSTYSPVPVKPYQEGLYPTAPQHFPMKEPLHKGV